MHASAADIVFRYMQRLGQALAERLERLHSGGSVAAAPASVLSEALALAIAMRLVPPRGLRIGSLGAMSRVLGGPPGCSRDPASRMSLNVPGPAAADVLSRRPLMRWPARHRGLAVESTIVTEATMDGIQPIKGNPHRPSPIVRLRARRPWPSIRPRSRRPSNYLQALRRRFWMVLAVAVPLAIWRCDHGAADCLRSTSAKAEIEINPPGLDPTLSTLVVARHRPARSGEPGALRPQPRRAAQEQAARRSRSSATRPRGRQLSQYDDPATELFKSLAVVQVQEEGQYVHRHPRGPRPARTKKLLEILLDEFKRRGDQGRDDGRSSTTTERLRRAITCKKLKEGPDGTRHADRTKL